MSGRAPLPGGLPAGIVRDDADLAPHLTDWRGQKRGEALALLQPCSTAEVQEVVRWAALHRIGLVPQGGNTGLVGGGVPEPGGMPCVVLSLARMNRISAIDPDGLSLAAQAGVILDNVHQAAAEAGCRFPLSLGARGSATIGGLVSTNAGGVQVLRHGQMRHLVLGLEAVLPDGSVLGQLSPLRKDNSGYDVKQLLIGGEGTLGVVTEVALKLSPALTQTSVGWLAVPSVAAALAVLARLRQRLGERIESFEIMAADALALVLDRIPGSRIPTERAAPWHVLIEAEVAVDALEAVLVDALAAHEATDAAIAASGQQAGEMWALRENIPVAERTEGKAIKNDIAVPVVRVPAFHDAAVQMFARLLPGARPLVFGHLGDGNLHWNLRPPKGVASDPWVADNEAAARRAIHDLVVSHQGTISAEHGIGTAKAAELRRLGDPGKLAAMRAIKAALDPLDILNPGKMFA